MRLKQDAKFVLQAREQLGLSQAALAKKLALHHRTILRWENGQIPVPRMASMAINQLLEQNEQEQEARIKGS